MKCFKYSTKLTYFIFLYLLIPQNVYAYLDPGTGSFILQLIIATSLGVAFAIKVYLKKIKTFFSNRFSKRPRYGEDDD